MFYIDHAAAKKQFIRNIDAIIAEFDSSDGYSKYTEIISKNIKQGSIEGVDDQFNSERTVPGGGLNKLFSYKENDLFVPEGMSMQSIFERAHMNGLAANMALSEVLLRHKLTSSIVMGVVSIDDCNFGSGIGNNKWNWLNNDSHHVGAGLSLYGFTKFYKCISGCLLGLRKSLVDLNLWDKTVIHVHGDFNRNPRADGIGTDHGPSGSNTTIFSGLIDGTHLIGDTYVGNPGEKGDWGFASRFTGGSFKNEEFTNHHIEASFANIFGVKSSVLVQPLFEISTQAAGQRKIAPSSDVSSSGKNKEWPT